MLRDVPEMCASGSCVFYGNLVYYNRYVLLRFFARFGFFVAFAVKGELPETAKPVWRSIGSAEDNDARHRYGVSLTGMIKEKTRRESSDYTRTTKEE